MKFPKLECDSILIVGCFGEAFPNNHDLKSQLGCIILLMDDNNAAIPVLLKIYKSRRVTHSVLSAKVSESMLWFSQKLKIQCNTQCQFTFSVAQNLVPRTSETRIMFDMVNSHIILGLLWLAETNWADKLQYRNKAERTQREEENESNIKLNPTTIKRKRSSVKST